MKLLEKLNPIAMMSRRAGLNDPPTPSQAPPSEGGDDDNYTTLKANEAHALAAGRAVGPGALAVAEAAVGLWERCMSAVSLEPAEPRVTAQVLALAGRELAVRGESLWLIRAGGLIPVASFASRHRSRSGRKRYAGVLRM